MTPTDYVLEELRLWEQALREQREAEERLAAARRAPPGPHLLELLDEVHGRRVQADLLLADAVRQKCYFRERRDGFAELAGPDDMQDIGFSSWLWPRQGA